MSNRTSNRTSDRSGGARVEKQRGRAPWWVPLLNLITKVLLAAGVPLGTNGLITIRGRKSGPPRATPAAIIEVGGKRWVWAPPGRGAMGAQSARG